MFNNKKKVINLFSDWKAIKMNTYMTYLPKKRNILRGIPYSQNPKIFGGMGQYLNVDQIEKKITEVRFAGKHRYLDIPQVEITKGSAVLM